ITVTGPANATLPGEAEVLRLFTEASTAKVAPWTDAPPKPLMSSLPTPGKVTATTEDKSAGATVWTLSNGIKVIVRPTTFNNDSIEINGWKKGGASLVPDVLHGRFATQVVASGGVGDLDRSSLTKTLAGKVVN